MALTVTLLDSGAQGFDTGTDTGFVSASITPGTDCVLVLCVGGISGSANVFAAGTTVVSSGSGPTWTKRDFQNNVVNVATAMVWTAEIGGSSPGAFTVTADWAGALATGAYAYSIHTLTGHDTVTPYGGFVTTTGQAGDGAVTVTLSAAPATDDVTVAICIADINTVGGASTFGAGTWTQTAAGAAVPDVSWNSGYRTGSTSASVPWTDVNGGDGNFSSAQAAIVVKAGATDTDSARSAPTSGPGSVGPLAFMWQQLVGVSEATNVDATATPDAISLVAAVPAVTTQAGTVVLPAATTIGPMVIPQAVLAAGSVVLPAAITAGPIVIPQAVLQAGSTVTPAAIPLAVVIPQAAASGGSPATVTPDAIALSVTISQVTPAAGSVVTPAAILVGPIVIPAATPQAGSTVSPAVIPLSVTIPAATTAAGSVVLPAAITAGPIVIPAATLQAGSTVSPAVIPLSVTIPAATGQGATPSTATPAAITISVTIPQVSPRAGWTVAPAAITLAVTIPAAVASGSKTATPAVIPLTVTIPAATGQGATSATATPNVISLVAVMPPPTVLYGQTVSPNVIALAMALGAVFAGSPFPVTGLRVYVVDDYGRIYTVDVYSRTMSVADESRTVTVPADRSRVVTVADESRTLTVEAP